MRTKNGTCTAMHVPKGKAVIKTYKNIIHALPEKVKKIRGFRALFTTIFTVLKLGQAC